ncbi:maleylacetate reductase [Ramlibacter tataouinensis]|uniref:maleylacetate reductase n=1 Tax=Ramlibacter tataouinensis TaxID=94132 RepID=UPI0022F3FACD|nr:maleylacetate reductase [Ramlibacter tataouinensis]WBY01254.1 maleylacetate reductase [Ramlibacter tataouinensis]
MRSERDFTWEGRPGRVVFGAGSLQHLEREVQALGASRALVLCGPQQRATAEALAARLGPRAAGVFDGAAMHVPIEVARQARALARQAGADLAIAVGGGSTIGLAKAIALASGLPILAIPTTYAGSEMTPIHGITEGGLKKTGRDARVLPRCVIYDPDLLASLPAALAVTSGFNAIAHAAEGLYAADGNPVMDLMAQEGIRATAAALPLLANGTDDERRPARADALYGAWLCGTVLGSVVMGLHHKLCHTLGGSFDLPHAETHTVMLPHTLAYNASHAPQALARIAGALGAPGNAPEAIFRLQQATGAPTSLRELGMPESGLDRVAELAVQTPYPNPRPLERGALRALLQRAYDGAGPQAR